MEVIIAQLQIGRFDFIDLAQVYTLFLPLSLSLFLPLSHAHLMHRVLSLVLFYFAFLFLILKISLQFSVHSAAAIVKKFFSELPIRLFPSEVR